MRLEDQLDQCLRDFNSRFGSKLSLGSGLTCGFRDSTGLHCILELDPGTEELCLYAEVGRVESGQEEKQLRRILRLSLLGHKTGGGGLSLAPDNQRIFLWWRLPLEGLNGSLLEKAIQRMVVSGREVRDQLNQGENKDEAGEFNVALSGALRI